MVTTAQIKIKSLEEIEKTAKNGFSENTALISIGDVGSKAPELIYTPKWILRLEFEDISLDDEEYGDKEYTIFNESMADEIADFVNEHQNEVQTIICQCEYGQSRSAGVAAAILEYFHGNGIYIFADDRYYPNKLVFRLTLEALNKK